MNHDHSGVHVGGVHVYLGVLGVAVWSTVENVGDYRKCPPFWQLNFTSGQFKAQSCGASTFIYTEGSLMQRGCKSA